MIKQRVKRRPLAEINIVPYVDVMLVLLVIFMVTTPLLNQGVEVKLPQAQAKAIKTEQQTPLIVTVDSKGQYYLNVAQKPHQPVNQVVLVNRIAAELRVGKDRQVLVKADDQVPYGTVMQAMTLLQHAGAPSVGLLTQPIGKEG